MEITFIAKTVILALAAVVNFALALAVFRTNPRNATNRLYAALGLVIIAWMAANYLSIVPGLVDSSLIFIRLSIFFATAMAVLFFLFTHTIPSSKVLIKPRHLITTWIVAGITMVITLSPLAFSEVDIVDNAPIPVAGPGIGIFTLVSVFFTAAAIYTLIRKLRHSVGRVKQQLVYVLAGIMLMLGLIITTIFIPVVLFKVNLVAFIPIYTIIFLGFTTVAIIKHRLFDIRTVIARSVAYLLVVTTFVALYTFAALILSYFVLGDEHIDAKQHVSYIILALIFTPTIYWLKKVFDKVTNKLFFRDAYNAQDFLNQLNKVLVSTIETEELLSRSAILIGQTVKPDFCTFAIRPLNGKSARIIGGPAPGLDVSGVAYLQQHLPQGFKGLLIADEVSDEHAHLRTFLRDKNIGLLVRLGGAAHKGGEGYGYLILGVKKSGNLYSQQDIKTIEIVGNELTIAIQNALRFEEIENFNRTLQDRVNEATRKMRKTNDRLRLLDQTKDDFISMASHQLRTPLTSVKGYVSMVLDGDGGQINETQRKLLTQSFLSSQRMVYLISDLLNLSRLKTGKFVIEPVETDLAAVIDEEVEQLAETVKSRNLELLYDKPENFPALMLDETKMRQVIMNFIDNAIYYTPSGGHITVRLAEKPESIEFTVVDDGIGVPKQDQHHLFSKFFRAHNAKSARPDGTGLGLFMAKKVVIAQGGATIFRSVEGKGSTFGFTFPKAKLLPKPGAKPTLAAPKSS